MFVLCSVSRHRLRPVAIPRDRTRPLDRRILRLRLRVHLGRNVLVRPHRFRHHHPMQRPAVDVLHQGEELVLVDDSVTVVAGKDAETADQCGDLAEAEVAAEL